MPKAFLPRKRSSFSIQRFSRPLKRVISGTPPLVSRGNKPLELTFEQELTALMLFHLEEHRSGQELLQFLDDDDVARAIVGVPDGIKQSTFYEVINTRGLEQMIHVFTELQRIAVDTLPIKQEQLGDIVAIDGSFIEATLTMEWADYRGTVNKAKAHVGFDLNRSIPSKIYLADGKSDERPYVSIILKPGQTGVIDRYYQCYRDFDTWQAEDKHFVCRIRESSIKTCLHENDVVPDGPVFYDAADYSALIPRCEKMGPGIIGMKPMGSDNMIEFARKQGFFNNKKANIARAMLRHVYQKKEIDSTIPAMNSMEELITNLESAYNPSLSFYEKSMLKKLSATADSTNSAYLPNHYKWLENWAVKKV